MKISSCTIRTNKYYTLLVKGLLEPQGIEEFKQLSKIPYSRYDKATKNERIIYVRDAMELAKEQNNTEALARLKAYEQELMSAVQKIYGENISRRKEFQPSLTTEASFLPVLTSELNQVLVKSIKRDLYNATENDLENDEIIVDNEDLNQAIIRLKNRLVATLQDFLGLPIQPIDFNNPSEYKQFIALISRAEDKLGKIIDTRTKNGKIMERESPEIKQEILSPLQAFVMLTNFDAILEKFTNNRIKTENDYMGQAFADTNKWYFNAESYYEASFLDDYSTINGAHTTTNQLKEAVGQIPIVGSRETLDVEVLRQIITHISHLYQDEDNYIIKKSGLFDPNTSNAKQKQAIIDILRKCEQLRSSLGSVKCDSLAAWLEKYNNLYKSKILNNIDQKSKFELTRDLLGQLVSAIKNQQHAIFVQTTDSGNQIVTNIDRGQKKIAIYKAITSTAAENCRLGYDDFYNPGFEIADAQSLATVSSLMSSRTLRALHRIFGLSFGQEYIQNKFSTDENFEILGEMVGVIQDLYHKWFGLLPNHSDKVLQDAAKGFEEELVRTQAFKRFSDLLVEDQAIQLHVNKDQQLNTLPGETIYSLTGDFRTNLDKFRKAFGTKSDSVPAHNLSTNILSDIQELTKTTHTGLNKDGFVGHSCFRSDVCVKDKNGELIILPNVLLEPSELIHVSLNHDYLTSIVRLDTMFLQVGEYADKPRTPIMAYNMTALVRIGTAVDPIELYKYNETTLKQAIRTQQKFYYDGVSRQICNKWNVLFGKQFNNLLDIVSFLENNPINEQDLHEALYELQQVQGVNLNLIKDVDYVVDSNGFIRINNSLILKVAASQNSDIFDAVYEQDLNQFLQNLSDEGEIRIDLGSQQLTQGERKKLCEILDFTYTIDDQERIISAELDEFLRSSWTAKNEDGSLLWKKQLGKYFALQTLLKDADMQITMKMPWIHDIGKKGVNLTHAQISSLFSGDKTNISLILKKDYSQRYLKGTKRNSIAVTTSTRLDDSNQFGVGKHFRFAAVQFPTTWSQTHFGKSDDLKGHDGASFTNPIFAVWEEHSWRGHEYKGTKKTIGIIQTPYGITQIKHADNVMSNEWLRRSFYDPTGRLHETEFNGENIMQAMLSPAKLTSEFITNWKNAQDNKDSHFAFNYPAYNFNGRVAQLINVIITPENQFQFEWRYLDNNELVSAQLVADLCGVPLYLDQTNEMNLATIPIENVYQLWKAFGGSEALEELNDGTIDFTESNNELVANLISMFDTSGQMKQTMIAKIVDTESIKSCPIGINSAKDLTNQHLTFATIESSSFGLQQDYTHESGDSVIPALTQVITAIAFNGHNQELVNNAYESLGQVINDSLKPFLDKAADPARLNRYLGEKLLKTLQKNSVASTAKELVQEFLTSLQKDRVLAFSHKDLFYKVTSDLVSALNNDTIKQKFAGIAVIQCPAQGILGIYEDKSGNKYTRSDIIKLAHQDKSLFINDRLLSGQTLVNAYISEHPELFGDLLITEDNSYLISIGDVVNGERITTPQKLRKCLALVHAGEVVVKNLSHQRDLKTTNITWKEESGRTINLYETMPAIIMANENESNERRQLARLWYNLNLKLLKTGKYIATEEEFKNYINSNGTEYIAINITDLKHQFGEQVIPKVHTAFHLGNHSLSEIKKNPKYFRDRVERNLRIQSIIADQEVGIATDNAEIILTNKNIPAEEINTRIEYDEIQQKLCVKDLSGNILCYISRSLIENKLEDTYVDVKYPNNENYNRAPRDFSAVLSEVNGKQLLIIHIEKKGNWVNQLYDTIKAIDGGRDRHINNIEVGESLKKDLKIDIFKHDIISGKTVNENIDIQAQDVYNSWLLQHLTVSTRIPSQSYQSFLPTETIAYTENDLNLGYMNIWEMFFQGSDFDIDKAYTLMYGVSKSGKIQGNAFTDYSSPKNIQDSLLLPIAKYGKIGVIENVPSIDSILVELQARLKTEATPTWKEIYDIVLANDPQIQIGSQIYGKYDIIKEIIDITNAVGSSGLYYISESTNKEREFIIQKLINYRNESQEGLKNRIAQTILTQASDLENLESSETPMSMKEMIDRIARIRKEKFIAEGGNAKDFSDDVYYSEYNPFTIFKIQRANSIGKLDVGIAANGIKAAGALQQHFNGVYRTITTADIKNNTEEYQRNKIHFDLDITTKTGRNIGKFNFFKLANTRISFDKFEALLNDGYGVKNLYGQFTGEYTHASYRIYQLLRDEKSIPKDYNSQKLRTAYNLYKQTHKNTIPSFVQLLYFAQSLEDNVADTISIFISMATDNAKELALAKIYGTPELLSLPLAMITLGMDIDSVIDVCVNILGDVAKVLERNRFNNGGYINVRDVIKRLSGYNEETIKSLLNIYDFAQELRSITSFFSVNQGVETKYAEMSSWLSSMANDRYRKFVDRNITLPENEQVITEDTLQKPLNYVDLFIDGSEEQRRVLKEYDLSKTIVNVMDVVLKSPHFREQLNAAGLTIDTINKICGKAFLVSQLVKTSDPINDDSNSSIDNIFGLTIDDVRKKNERAQLVSKSIRLIDHWVITNYLKTTPGMDLSISDIQKKFPGSNLNNLGSYGNISLDNKNGIRKFINFINQDLIQYLQAEFGYNTFIEGLQLKQDETTGLSYYDFKYDPYAVKDNPSLMDMFNTALKDFEIIKNVKTGIYSSTGREFTVGELLYLYSILTGKGETRGIYTITGQIAKESTLLFGGIEKQYERLDYMVQNPNKMSIENPNLTNMELLQQLVSSLQPRVKALSSPGYKTVLEFDGRSYSIDLSGAFLWTLPDVMIENGISIQNAEKLIEKDIPFGKVKITTKDLGNGEIGLNYQVILSTPNGTTIALPKINPLSLQKQTKSLRKVLTEANGHVINSQTFQEIRDELIGEAYGASKYILDPEISIALKKPDALNRQIMIDPKAFSELPKSIQDFFSSKQSVLLNNKGINQIQKINGKSLLIIDKNNFVGNDGYLYLTDLYIQSQPSTPTSENQKAAALINILAGYNICDASNYQRVLDELEKYNNAAFKELQKYKKLILDYNQFLLDRSDFEDLKHQGQQTLIVYEEALKYKDAYYTNDITDFSIPQSIQPGDLVIVEEDGIAIEKLCFGIDKQGNRWFIPTSKLDEPHVKVHTIGGINPIRSLRKLSISPEVRLGAFDINQFSYVNAAGIQNPTQECFIENLKVGDKFTVGTKNWVVANIVVHKYMTQQGITKKFIIVNQKNPSNIAIITPSADGQWKIQQLNAIQKQICPNVVKVTSASISGNITMTNPYQFNFMDTVNPVDENVKRYLINKLERNCSVIINGQILPVLGVIKDGETVTEVVTQFGMFSQKQIEQIGLNRKQLDPNGMFDVIKPKQIWNAEGTIIPWRPDLADGYIITKTKRNLGTKSNKNWELLTAVIKFDGKPCPSVTLPGNYTHQESDKVYVGDIFISYIPDEQATIVSYISKQTTNGDYVVVKKKYLLNNIALQETETKVHLQTAEDLINTGDRYTTFENATSGAYAASTEIYAQTTDACHEFLKNIQKVTGLPIHMINKPNREAFAEVTDTAIFINLAKKPETMSKEMYIMSQAAHEFGHVILAGMKAQNPTAYAELMSKVNDIVDRESDLFRLVAENPTYNFSETMILEEVFVRGLEQEIVQLKDFDKAGDVLNDYIQSFFSTSAASLEYADQKLSNYLKRFASMNYLQRPQSMDIRAIQTQMISEKIFDKIERIC